jgi:hypothetical protein
MIMKRLTSSHFAIGGAKLENDEEMMKPREGWLPVLGRQDEA